VFKNTNKKCLVAGIMPWMKNCQINQWCNWKCFMGMKYSLFYLGIKKSQQHNASTDTVCEFEFAPSPANSCPYRYTNDITS